MIKSSTNDSVITEVHYANKCQYSRVC